VNDIISKSEEHFGADSYEVGYALKHSGATPSILPC
jgi:hypothetical protein